MQPDKTRNLLKSGETEIQTPEECGIDANMSNSRGYVPIVKVYSKRGMGSDKQDQSPYGVYNNQPSETSGISWSAQKKMMTVTRRYIGYKVHVETSKKSLGEDQPGIVAVLITRTKNIANKVPFDIFCKKTW